MDHLIQNRIPFDTETTAPTDFGSIKRVPELVGFAGVVSVSGTTFLQILSLPDRSIPFMSHRTYPLLVLGSLARSGDDGLPDTCGIDYATSLSTPSRRASHRSATTINGFMNMLWAVILYI
jgi:hypothetical protein